MIILSLLVDQRIEKRRLGVSLIQEARNAPQSDTIRFFNKEFKLKKLNFAAQDYDQMVDLEVEEITEPPCLKHLDENDLEKIVFGEKDLKEELGNVLCHSTHCERAVAMTTKAAEQFCGYEARHGFIISKHNSLKSFGRELTKTEWLEFKHDFETSEMDTSE